LSRLARDPRLDVEYANTRAAVRGEIGTNERGSVTNAAVSVTKRPRLSLRFGPQERRLLLAQYATWLSFNLLGIVVNAVSVASDIARSRSGTAAWEPWVWEATSWLGFAVAAPLIFVLSNEAARRGVRPVVRLLAFAVISVPFSALHVALMIGARHVAYDLVGRRYGVWPWLTRFLYEYPKDLVALVLILGVGLFWRVALARQRPQEAQASAPSFLVRDTSGQTQIRAAEIDWVEAQGNYAALHAGDRTHLVRQTMSEVEEKLIGAGFLRTHRSALVSLRVLRGIGRDDAGGLVVVLEGDGRAPLSQARKAAVLAALKGGPPLLREEEKASPPQERASVLGRRSG
jgi:DNA-binding LytR/AlgR family response regulator